MTQPAAEQLLNLADRAERHTLTPNEAQRLRDGLTHHCARAEQAEAEVERMKLLVAASSEEGHAARMAAQHAERAIENGKRADRAEQLATDLRAQAITEQKRAERAEAALAALKRAHIALAEQAGKDQAAIERARAYAHELRHKDATGLLATLDEQQEQPTTAEQEQPVRAPDGTPLCTCTYGKRCPACRD